MTTLRPVGIPLSALMYSTQALCYEHTVPLWPSVHVMHHIRRKRSFFIGPILAFVQECVFVGTVSTLHDLFLKHVGNMRLKSKLICTISGGKPSESESSLTNPLLS
jgi:hypothetical protein